MRRLTALFTFAFLANPLIATASEPTPLSIAQAIDTALRNNPSYRTALVATDAAFGRARQARAGLSPSLAISDYYQYTSTVAELQTPFGPLPFSPNSTNVPLASASYALYNPVTVAQSGAAAAALAQSRASEREARGVVVADVTRAYYDLIVAESASRVAREGVDVALRHQKDAQQQFDAGQVPRADVLAARTDVAARQLDAISADNAVTLAQNALDAVLNVPMTIAHRPTDAIPSRAPEVELNSLIASAKATRGELSAASAAIDAASYALRAAQSGRFPRVSAAISEGNTQPVVQQAYKPQFTFSLQAVWQLFDGGLSDGREAEATANLDEARLQLERLNNDVELGVRQAYATMLAAQARVVAAQALVQSANEGERLSEVRYRGGVGTALELREADLRAIGARREELEAHAALARSVTDLRFASGLL